MPGVRRGARCALCDRRSHGGDQPPARRSERHGLPRGVLDAVPRDLVADSLDPLAVRQCGRCGHGHRCGAARAGQARRAGRRAGRRRRHHRHRLRLPVRHVRTQRRRALHLLRQRGVHEHGRAAFVGDAASRANQHDDAGRRIDRRALRPGQEPAAHRHGARDSLRRDGDGRRAPRPRSQGAACDGIPRRTLHPRAGALPARLGSRLGRDDQDGAAREGDGVVPGLRGRTRRSEERIEDPAAVAGRGLPEAADPVCAPVQATGACGSRRTDPGAGRSQRASALAWWTTRRTRSEEAVCDHARPRLEPCQPHGLVAHGAPRLCRPPAAVQRRVPVGREHPGLAVPR